MKLRKNFLTAIVGLGLIMMFNPGCDLEEQCEQAEICTGKYVSTCCTETECYYTYNGTRYEDTDADLSQLAIDIGCANSSSPNFEEELDLLKQQLIDIKNGVLIY